MSSQGGITVGWLATPCGTITLAKEFALRSAAAPIGVAGLWTSRLEEVCVGNARALFPANFCACLLTAQSYFVIGNPTRSCLWLLQHVVGSAAIPGVGFVSFFFRALGVMCWKSTTILTICPDMTLVWDVDAPAFAAPCALRSTIQW